MDIKEIKDFFAEVDNIPQDKKDGITRFLFGVSLLSSDPDKLSGILFENKDFEELYNEFVDAVIKDKNLVEKDMILKRVSDEKELIEKIHRYYVLKREVTKTVGPLGLYGTILEREGGIGSMSFFLIMSMFALSRANIPPESAALDISNF